MKTKAKKEIKIKKKSLFYSDLNFISIVDDSF